MGSDPSSFSLPPEWVEAIERACERRLTDSTAAQWTADDVCDALEPLLAERDGRAQEVRSAERAGRRAAEEEARGLREALASARTRLEQCQRDRTERDKVYAQAQSGIHEIDAALSASPDTEPDTCSDCDGTGIGGHGGTCPTCAGSRVAPVSVPEQEAGRAATLCECCGRATTRPIIDDEGMDFCSRCFAELAQAMADERALAALRERLTSDPIVELLALELGGVWNREHLRRALAAVADHLENRDEEVRDAP